MGELIFKFSSPKSAIEVQIPVFKPITELDAIKKLVSKETDSDTEDVKKSKKKKKTNSDTTKVGAGTLGVLLASVLLAAMKED